MCFDLQVLHGTSRLCHFMDSNPQIKEVGNSEGTFRVMPFYGSETVFEYYNYCVELWDGNL